MPNLGVTELLIIVAVLVLLFGSRRLPDMARSLGRSMRVFKAETKGMREEDEDTGQSGQPSQAQPSSPTQLPASQARSSAQSQDHGYSDASR